MYTHIHKYLSEISASIYSWYILNLKQVKYFISYNLHICIYIYIHTYTYTHTYTHIYTYTYTYICIPCNTHIHKYMSEICISIYSWYILDLKQVKKFISYNLHIHAYYVIHTYTNACLRLLHRYTHGIY